MAPTSYRYVHPKIKKRKVSRPHVTLKSHTGYYGTETKFRNNQLTTTALSTSWQTLNPTTADTLTAVTQGTSESQHLGRTMFMTSLHLKGEFFVTVAESATTPAPDAVVRYAIVLDTDTKGTEVTATDVFDASQTTDRFAFRNLQHTSRLKVFHDRTFMMRPVNMNEGAINLFAHGTRTHQFSVNLHFKKPIRVLFSGTTAVVGDIVDNSFHFVCISSGAAVSVSYQVRLRFKDTL